MNTYEFSGYVLDKLAKNQEALRLKDIPLPPPSINPEWETAEYGIEWPNYKTIESGPSPESNP